MEKVCCFTGHREINQNERASVTAALRKLLPSLIEQGYRVFKAGGAIGFDMLAAGEVIRLKRNFPDIKLHLFLPCMTQNKYYNEEQNRVYLEQINAADKIFCMSEKYYNGCMQDRNRALVDGSELCIAYIKKESGGTAYTVSHAEKNGVEVVRL